MSRFSEHFGSFNRTWLHFDSQWQEVRATWKDQVALNFERQHFKPLEAQVQTYLRELGKLAKVVESVERDLGSGLGNR